MKKALMEKLIALITAAFGLVAALAWNEAIKALFVGPCKVLGVPNPSAGALCAVSTGGPWVYAVIVTVIAVVVILVLGKIQEGRKDEKKKE